jgi:sigma-B regulation protein RsbU (phosphoserine phosphatase)
MKIEQQKEDLFRVNQRMKQDLDAAARVQQTLLPEGFPEIQGLNFAWTYRPCDELAGDALNSFSTVAASFLKCCRCQIRTYVTIWRAALKM